MAGSIILNNINLKSALVMNFAALQKQYFNSRQKITAAVFTSIIALILVTPLCGFLFDCGCTWPWSGLDSECNFHQHDTVHKCPWCASWIIGWFSVGVSIASGAFVVASPLPILGDRVRNESLIRILLGTMTFLCVAIIAGWLAAEGQNFPGSINLRPSHSRINGPYSLRHQLKKLMT
jgi:hypothetical protein